MNKKNWKKNGITVLTIVIVLSFVYSVNVQPAVFGNPFEFIFGFNFEKNQDSNLQTFSDYKEFINFLKSNNHKFTSNGYYYDSSPFLSPRSLKIADGSLGMAESDSNDNIEYSETNIQVESVDEPDIVKTDGNYVCLVANSKIYIIKAYPAENAKLLANISMDDETIINIFIKNDKLIVFALSSRTIFSKQNYSYYLPPSLSTTIVNIYDITDKKDPEIFKEVEIDGRYIDSRLIGKNVYVITQENTYNIIRELNGNETVTIPEISINNIVRKIPAENIHYSNISETLDTMNHIISINFDNGDVKQESYMIGNSQNMYVSKNNIYLTTSSYEYIESNIFNGRVFPDYIQNTIIHKISINNGKIKYISKGEVPGHILNQFSMDEYNNYFRIATTVGNVWEQETKSKNNIYILDKNMNLISKIENIAPGEKIYSARFMGEKAYLVTFKKVDPFFTIDLSDPNDPKILGKLKIPGYSDYLHPYDENHIIGIGKDTVEALESQKESRNLDFAWYQGIKIALFDVTDFDNPQIVSQVVIGDRGTNSPALYDHKAFLFDKEKGLLVIPVSVHEISEQVKEQNNNYTGNIYGDFTFQGSYVYNINLDGFEYKGRITHMDEQDFKKTDYYWGYSGYNQIKRSLYIDDFLYTISDNMIKINSLSDLSEINSVLLY